MDFCVLPVPDRDPVEKQLLSREVTLPRLSQPFRKLSFAQFAAFPSPSIAADQSSRLADIAYRNLLEGSTQGNCFLAG